MPTCELITIGSELLDGSTLNTNAQFLARRLSGLDIEVTHQASYRDVMEDITCALELSFYRSDIVILSGGLGPTPDDITREAVAKFFNSDLILNQGQYKQIKRYFARLGRATPLMTRREALFPKIAKPILNRFGIALGFYIEKAGHLLIALPGVPRELMGMYEDRVESLIRSQFKNRPKSFLLEARLIGLSEMQIMRRLGKSFFKNRQFGFGIYPAIGEVTIRIKTKSQKLLHKLKKEIQKKLKSDLYSLNGNSIAYTIQKAFVRRRLTLAVSESSTGGWLAKKLTDEPGASQYFLGGVVAYSNRIKSEVLNVPFEILQKYGAVSSQTAGRMAEGTLCHFGASCALSITGIAGPTGGSAKKPVGLVYIGIAQKTRRTRILRFRFGGSREHVRLKAVQKALELIWRGVRAVH